MGNGEVLIEDVIGALSHLSGGAKASSVWDLKCVVHQMRSEHLDSITNVHEKVSRVEATQSTLDGRLGNLEKKIDRLCVLLGDAEPLPLRSQSNEVETPGSSCSRTPGNGARHNAIEFGVRQRLDDHDRKATPGLGAEPLLSSRLVWPHSNDPRLR